MLVFRYGPDQNDDTTRDLSLVLYHHFDKCSDHHFDNQFPDSCLEPFMELVDSRIVFPPSVRH